MEEAALKIDLHEKIDHPNSEQLKQLYGLVINYFNSQYDYEEWDSMPDLHKQLIEKAIEQDDAGLGTPLKDINKSIKAQYGLND